MCDWSLGNGGRIEVAQRMAGHSNRKRQNSMTGAATMLALTKWSGLEFDNSISRLATYLE
jgi:hypothetical protein